MRMMLVPVAAPGEHTSGWMLPWKDLPAKTDSCFVSKTCKHYCAPSSPINISPLGLVSTDSLYFVSAICQEESVRGIHSVE